MSTTSALPFVRPAAVAGRHFSTVIVGAGINGVGVFRDLSLQGVDCLIVDKGDFSAGASSAPSRMIHGGLRYLESGSFSLVAEATRELSLRAELIQLRNDLGELLASLEAPRAPASVSAAERAVVTAVVPKTVLIQQTKLPRG